MMKVVIDIPESIYDAIMDDEMISREQLAVLEKHIYYGTPLPEGVEILTKEAYSDLCTRAADVPDFESEEYVEQKLENYNKLLKSGILDCVKEKSQESEDKE